MSSISIFNASNVLLETLVLYNGLGNAVTPDSYYGFQRSTAEISRLTLTNNYIGMRNITVSDVGGAVPEAATWAMMLVGFGAMGVALRSRRRVQVRFG